MRRHWDAANRLQGGIHLRTMLLTLDPADRTPHVDGPLTVPASPVPAPSRAEPDQETALEEVTGLMEYLQSPEALRNARRARERRIASRPERRRT